MNKPNFDRYVADVTKDIVVSKMQNSQITPNETNGAYVADFYNAIFNGIRAELEKTGLLND